jgi:hypothetical protein
MSIVEEAISDNNKMRSRSNARSTMRGRPQPETEEGQQQKEQNKPAYIVTEVETDLQNSFYMPTTAWNSLLYVVNCSTGDDRLSGRYGL